MKLGTITRIRLDDFEVNSAAAGIQLQAYSPRYRLETESKAQLHANAIVLCIY